MNTTVLFYSLAHWLRSDATFWYMLLFLLSFPLWILAFLITGHHISKSMEIVQRQEGPISEHNSQSGPQTSAYYYTVLVTLVVLILGLIASAWPASQEGETNKPITSPKSPVSVSPDTSKPMTSGCTNAVQSNIKKPRGAMVYTYQTENAWGGITKWQPAPNLSFAIDIGNGPIPATLEWTDQQGNAASISFQTDMCTFFGYFQRPNEGPIAYRGTLLSKRPFTQDVSNLGQAQHYTYQTENAWGDIAEWHDASNLSFAIDSGDGAIPSTLKWKDQKGYAGSISFQTDMSTFFGYLQKPNEGPIAYRGTLIC